MQWRPAGVNLVFFFNSSSTHLTLEMPEPVATPTAAVDTEKTASKKSLVLDLDGCLISVGPLWSYEKVVKRRGV